jgi:two-component system, NtrC family, response regulator GlrR
MTQKPNDIGQKTILFMNADPEESAGISFLLEEADFSTHSVASPAELKKKMKEASFMAVIIDLDSVAVDNRTIRDLASQFPTIPFLCLSRERFHPELKDSIRDHIYACLTKPIDPDELGYWLKCIREDDRSLRIG